MPTFFRTCIHPSPPGSVNMERTFHLFISYYPISLTAVLEVRYYISPFNRSGGRNPEKVSNQPKVAELPSGRAEI